MDSNYAKQYQRLEREHWWWIVRREFVFAALQHNLPANRNGRPMSLLEVGCGAGANLQQARQAFDCQGVEPDPELREIASREARCPVMAGSLPGPLPLEDHSFDICLLLDVLEHVEDDRAALREIHRLVRAGGLVVMNVPAMPSLWSVHDEVNQHFRRYTARQLLDVIRAADLEVHSIRFWGTALVPLIWLERKLISRSVNRTNYEVKLPSWPVQSLLASIARVDYALNPLCRVAGSSLMALCSTKVVES